MSLPANIATPTLITGKTNQSQVVDVYEGSTVVQDGAAQNKISSVLSGTAENLLSQGKDALSNILKSKDFKGDMKSLLKAAIKGDINSDMVKDKLKAYKNGALSSILEANGIGDPKKFRDDFVEGLELGMKGIAFGSIKGMVDGYVPGLLDDLGIKSFDDAKRVYEETSEDLKNLKNDFKISKNDVIVYLEQMAGDDLGNISEDLLEIAVDISGTVLDNCIDVLNTVLEPELKVAKTKDQKLDTAILASATTPIVEVDHVTLNEYVLDSFGEDKKGMTDYLRAMIPIAVQKGSYKFITVASRKLSKEEISWMVGMSKGDFLTKVNINPLPSNAVDRLAIQEEIITAIEIVSLEDRSKFNPGAFKGLTDSAFEILKYGQYANIASLGKFNKPLTATEIMNANFNDFIIT